MVCLSALLWAVSLALAVNQQVPPVQGLLQVHAPPPTPPPPVFVGVTCGKGGNSSFAGATYCDRNLSNVERADAIIALMTVQEKLLNLDATNYGVARLGIRQMQFGEGLHGVLSQCGAAVGEPDEFGPRTGCPTSYPSGIAEGATFNRDLWKKVGAADGRYSSDPPTH
jgi:hypothetical protein